MRAVEKQSRGGGEEGRRRDQRSVRHAAAAAAVLERASESEERGVRDSCSIISVLGSILRALVCSPRPPLVVVSMATAMQLLQPLAPRPHAAISDLAFVSTSTHQPSTAVASSRLPPAFPFL